MTRKTLLEKAYKSMALKKMEGVKVEDYSKENAQGVKKYELFTKEGYGFYFYKNDEAIATLKENVDFPKLKNLQILGQEGKKSYEVVVKPGESCIVLLQSIGAGYSYSTRVNSKVSHGDNYLKEMCRSKGTKEGRLEPQTDKDIGVNVFSFTNSEGYCFLYSNKSKKYVLEETVDFELKGLHIDGMPPGTSEVTVNLQPGEEKFFKLVRDAGYMGAVQYGQGVEYILREI